MVTKRNIKIYCDGGARGNPGPAAYSFIVVENEKVVYKKSRFLGRRTNNFAEYSGVLAALEWLTKKSAELDAVSIFLDSQLAVKQLNGEYKVKSRNLKPLITKIKLLENHIDTKINFYFLPRAKNKLADFLVNICPRQALLLLTLPCLVILNLLVTPFLLFNFGIIRHFAPLVRMSTNFFRPFDALRLSTRFACSGRP